MINALNVERLPMSVSTVTILTFIIRTFTPSVDDCGPPGAVTRVLIDVSPHTPDMLTAVEQLGIVRVTQ
jgi:hypothetical protein